MAKYLPPEIEDLIIDHLHDNPVALRRIALVCRAFLSSARYHIWRQLRLKCTTEDLAHFSKLLDVYPDIAFYVRNVSVSQKKGHFCTWDDLTLLHTTLAVLSRLPQLATLTLDGLWFGAPTTENAVPLVSYAFPSIRKLTISTCSFDAFEDVRFLCSAFPALREVHFDGVWWGRWTGQSSQRVSGESTDAEHVHVERVLRWKELDLGSCFSRDVVVDWLLDSLEDGSVGSLRLPLISAYDTRLKDLLVRVGPSLQQLMIGSPSTSAARVHTLGGTTLHPLEALLDLSSCTSLRAISLGVPTYRDAGFITRWLSSILTQVHRASPTLEEVRFAIYPILRGDAGDAYTMLAAFGWDDIVRILLGLEPERQRPPAAVPLSPSVNSGGSQFAPPTGFVGLKKIIFCAGRAADYAQIPSAFVSLVPFMQLIAKNFFEPLERSGVQFHFEDAMGS